jgi:catechol 2,3-dioxygenase-like lactoylglutathione lyase family enzyme
MRILRIDHVQLAIPPGGEPAARRFYGEVLGLTEIPKPEAMRARGGMWFEGGIHLGIEPDMRPSAKVHPALVVGDVEAVRRTLVAAGCEWREADDLPGVRRGHTKDPFGNRLEITE